MKVKYIVLGDRYEFRKYPDTGSSVVYDVTIEQTEIVGIVKVAGTLSRSPRLIEQISRAAFLNKSLDEYMPSYWPKKLVEKETTFLEKIKSLFTTGKWVKMKQVYKYSDSVLLEEPFESIVKVSNIKTIQK